MVLEYYSKNKKILIAIFALVLLGGISYLAIARFLSEPEPVFCTMEAKLCPDGSYVGRTGPNCEFTACPAVAVEPDWKTFTDSILGVSFQYPESFLTTYMHALDWPPQIAVINEPFTCVEAGSEIARAGITEKYIINNHEYCVTKQSEGAAGSIYTQYAYALQRGEKVIIFTFSIRATQCGNYDDPKKTECENERASFDINSWMDRIAQTLRLDFVRAESNITSQLKDCLPKSDLASKQKCDALLKLITDYNECVSAGFSVIESNPPQCSIPDGRIFSENL